MLDGFGKLVRRICSKLAGQHKADTDPKGMSNNHLYMCVCVFFWPGGAEGVGGGEVASRKCAYFWVHR